MPLKTIVVILASYIVAYLLTFFLNIGTGKIGEVLLPTIGIILGLLIAGIGMFLGSINSIIQVIHESDSSLSQINKIDLINKIDSIILEIKSNSFFSIFVFIGMLFFYCWQMVDIPGISFIKWSYFNKNIATDSTLVWAVILMTLLIFDTVAALFKMYEIHSEIVKGLINAKSKQLNGIRNIPWTPKKKRPLKR